MKRVEESKIKFGTDGWRACLAMPMAPAMKNASTSDNMTNIPKKRNTTNRILCHPKLPSDIPI